jgi:hypothetical protein
VVEFKLIPAIAAIDDKLPRSTVDVDWGTIIIDVVYLAGLNKAIINPIIQNIKIYLIKNFFSFHKSLSFSIKRKMSFCKEDFCILLTY